MLLGVLRPNTKRVGVRVIRGLTLLKSVGGCVNDEGERRRRPQTRRIMISVKLERVSWMGGSPIAMRGLFGKKGRKGLIGSTIINAG